MRILTFASALAALVVAAIPSAFATTIDSFSFTQGGYTDGGVLTGTFSTSSPDGTTLLTLADLTSMHLTYTVGPAQSFGYTPFLFSYITAGGGSSLEIVDTTGIFGTVCVGLPASLGAGSGLPALANCGPGGNALGFFANASTQAGAIVTLLSSTTINIPPQPLPIPGPNPAPQPNPQPVLSPVPEPGSLPLLFTGLLCATAAQGLRRCRSAV